MAVPSLPAPCLRRGVGTESRSLQGEVLMCFESSWEANSVAWPLWAGTAPEHTHTYFAHTWVSPGRGAPIR